MLSILTKFAQISSDFNSDFDTSYTTSDTTLSGADTAVGLAGLGVMLVIWVVLILIAVVPVIVVQWKLFTKAGRPGWASIVPIYNIFVANEIAGTPTWYVILALLPGVSIVGYILIYIELAKKYSNPATVWLSLFLPIIALFMVGKTEYIGGGPDQQSAMQPNQGFNVPPAGQFQANSGMATPPPVAGSQPEADNQSTPNQPPTQPLV